MQNTKRLTLNIDADDLEDLHELARIGRTRAGILARQAVLMVLDSPNLLLPDSLADSVQLLAYRERRSTRANYNGD